MTASLGARLTVDHLHVILDALGQLEIACRRDPVVLRNEIAGYDGGYGPGDPKTKPDTYLQLLEEAKTLTGQAIEAS